MLVDEPGVETQDDLTGPQPWILRPQRAFACLTSTLVVLVAQQSVTNQGSGQHYHRSPSCNFYKARLEGRRGAGNGCRYKANKAKCQ